MKRTIYLWLALLLSVAAPVALGQHQTAVSNDDKSVIYCSSFNTVPDYAGVGNETDNASRITAAFTKASAMAALKSGRRVKVVLPAGQYRIASRVTVPRWVDFDMRGATLVYTGTDYDGAILTVGESSGNDEGGIYLGLSAKAHDRSHLYPADKPYFAAIRLRNLINAHVEMGQCDNTNVGLMLFPDAGSPIRSVSLCKIYGGRYPSCKSCIQCRGNTSDGYVNQNTFYSPDFSPNANILPFGSIVGLHLTTEAGGYTGQDNNTLDTPCFQLAGWDSTYAWSSGKTGLTTGNRYRASNGWEYEKTAGGTTGGTDEPTSTTVGATFVDNASVTWTTRGKAMRVPIYCDGAGVRGKVRNARLETSYGPVLFDRTGGFADTWDIELAADDGHTEWGFAESAGRDIDTWSGASGITQLKLNSSIRAIGDPPAPSININNFHHRYIGSGSNYTLQGFAFMSAGTYDNFTIHGGSNASNILCRDSLYLDSGSVRPIVLFDTQSCKKFKITPDAPIFTGLNLDCLAYDNGFVQVEMDTTTRDVFGGTGTQAFGASDWMLTSTANDQNPRTYAVAQDSSARYLGFPLRSSVKWRGWRCDVIRDQVGVTYDLAPTTPFGPLNNGRYAYGTPDEGIFRQPGEQIANLNTTGGQPLYWTVTTPGALAPAWSSTTAVIEGELRNNAGDVYYAAAAGTTGTSAPTHGSGEVTDGGVLQGYLCPVAVLTASAATY